MRAAVVLVMFVVLACAAPREQVVVYEVEEGGSLSITTSKGTTPMTTPGTAAVRKDGRVERGARSTEALQAQQGAVLATLPAPPATYLVHFATGQTMPNAEGQAALAALLADMPRREVIAVQITGHTDQQGREAFNDRLALVRAETVKGLLVQGGVPAASVRVTGKGEREPLVDAPGQAEALNRRVEVIVR